MALSVHISVSTLFAIWLAVFSWKVESKCQLHSDSHHLTCCGQWNISRCNTCRLKTQLAPLPWSRKHAWVSLLKDTICSSHLRKSYPGSALPKTNGKPSQGQKTYLANSQWTAYTQVSAAEISHGLISRNPQTCEINVHSIIVAKVTDILALEPILLITILLFKGVGNPPAWF